MTDNLQKNDTHQKVLKLFHFKRIIIPIILGLGVASYLVIKDFDVKAFQAIDWAYSTFFWIFVALIMMGLRDLAYMIRIRLLTDNQISWKNSFQVIMLWEFASAVTPSVVGGSYVALYILNKEGIKMGKTTAIVMITALFDELFFIVMVPLIFLLTLNLPLFPTQAEFTLFNKGFGLYGIFWIGYGFILLLTFIILYGVFINPRGMKWLLLKIFKLPILRKWRNGARETGDDIIATSTEMKNKKISFWAKIFGITILSWTARYLVINFLILAFFPVDNHFLIYARQLIMWVVLLISPTPGGSGIAEYLFSDFLREFVNEGLSGSLALLWRLISYYPYLFIGAVILPTWLSRVYSKHKAN